MAKSMCILLIALLVTAASSAQPSAAAAAALKTDSAASADNDTTLRLLPKISFAAVTQKAPPVWQYQPLPACYQPSACVKFLVGVAYNSLYSDYERNLLRPRDPRWPPFPDEYHAIGLRRPESGR